MQVKPELAQALLHFLFFQMMKGYVDNQKKLFLLLSPLAIKQNSSSRLSNTLTKTTIHSNKNDSAHDSFPLLYDRFTTELFTKKDELRNPLVAYIHYAQTIVELSGNIIITSMFIAALLRTWCVLNGSVMNVVCYERVYYERVCYERGLL